MLGLDITKIKMELSTWESRVHPDDIKKCYEEIKAYINGEKNFYENIHRMQHRDGHWLYILDRGRVSARDKTGKPIKFTGSHFDVTELMSTKLKLDLFFKNSPFVFCFVDMDGRFLEMNEEFIRIIGYTRDEINQLSYGDINPRKYESDDDVQFKLLEKNKVYGPYRKEYIRKNGEHIPVELNGFMVEDYDGKKGIWTIVEDISKNLEKEKELALVLEGNKIGIWKYNPIDNSLDWDESMYSLYGMDKSKFSGAYDAWAQSLHPDYKENTQKELEDALLGKKDFDSSFAILTPQGETRYIKAKAIVDRDETGKALMVLGVNSDITDLKLAEKVKIELLEKDQKTNQKLEAIFNFSPIVVYECLMN